MSHRAVLALGSNLGDRASALQGAIDALAADPRVRVVAASSVYRTEPVGGPEQGEFLNAVVIVDTELDSRSLLALCMSIEQKFHRERLEHWGPRTLDVDVIAVDDIVQDDPVLILPHPRAGERAFVCLPWLETDPEAVLPGTGAVRDLLVHLDMSGVQRADDVVLLMPGSVT